MDDELFLLKVRASIHYRLPFSEFEERFTARDVAILRAFDALFLFGDKKTEVLAANEMALSANINRARDSKAFAPADFMLGFAPRLTDEEKKEKAIQEMKSLFGGTENGINC